MTLPVRPCGDGSSIQAAGEGKAGDGSKPEALSPEEEATLEELEERIEACRTQLEYKVGMLLPIKCSGHLMSSLCPALAPSVAAG